MAAFGPPEYRAFINAIKYSSLEEVERQLTDHPDFLDLPNSDGVTPLHYAAGVGGIAQHIKVELLLQRGSTSINSFDQSRRTPLHCAVRSGSDSTVALLLRFIRSIRSIRFGTEECISIDVPDSTGMTPFYYAVWHGRDSVVELLLRHALQDGDCISIDISEWCGMTPLHTAVYNGCNSTVKILKAIGCTTASVKYLTPQQIEKLQEPISEETVLEIRSRIYFSQSLLSCLL